ncbi:10245_t:CDS:2, partial [Gigaspora margarita]
LKGERIVGVVDSIGVTFPDWRKGETPIIGSVEVVVIGSVVDGWVEEVEVVVIGRGEVSGRSVGRSGGWSVVVVEVVVNGR